MIGIKNRGPPFERLDLLALPAGLVSNLPEKSMRNSTQHFFKGQRGVTAIEYGLIAALIVIGIVVALTTVGTDLQTVFSTIAADLDSAVTGF